MNVDEAYKKGWLYKANQDLLTFEVLAASKDDLVDTAAFHAQQALEKWLKGLLILNKIRVLKIHDVTILIA